MRCSIESSTAWLGLSGLAGASALAAWLAADPTALRWQPDLVWSQPWRLFSAAFVHLSALHLAANLLGTVLVAALGGAARCGRRATLAWALAWPLTHVGLLLQPALGWYGGLSGVLHAGVAVAGWQLLRGGPGAQRRIGVLLAGGLLLKLLLEAPWQGVLRQPPGWDIAIAPLAHSSGAIAGLLCALVCGVGTARDPAQRG